MTGFAMRKVLGCLLMPAGLLGLLLLAATILAWRRSRKAGIALLALTVLYALAGNVQLGNRLMLGLERAYPAVDLAALEPYDAVYVLGGGADRDDLGGAELTAAGDRFLTATRLWFAGRTRRLVAGGVAPGPLNGRIRDGGEVSRELWLALGVPPEAILVLDRPCLNTKDEIRACRALREREGWRRLGLVSSASHLPRVQALARRSGLEAEAVPADRQGRHEAFQLHHLIPQGHGFDLIHTACWEHLGRLADR
jgi:uncharacterized SAM-binding protein YcdF (DUF218 family)